MEKMGKRRGSEIWIGIGGGREIRRKERVRRKKRGIGVRKRWREWKTRVGDDDKGKEVFDR